MMEKQGFDLDWLKNNKQKKMIFYFKKFKLICISFKMMNLINKTLIKFKR